MKDSRVDPSDCDNQAVKIAITNGHLEVAKELLRDKRVQMLMSYCNLRN